MFNLHQFSLLWCNPITLTKFGNEHQFYLWELWHFFFCISVMCSYQVLNLQAYAFKKNKEGLISRQSWAGRKKIRKPGNKTESKNQNSSQRIKGFGSKTLTGSYTNASHNMNETESLFIVSSFSLLMNYRCVNPACTCRKLYFACSIVAMLSVTVWSQLV